MARPMFRRALERMPTGSDDAAPALLDELQQRLVAIEQKSDATLDRLAAMEMTHGGYAGDPDQVYGCVTYAASGEDLIVLGLLDLLGVAEPSYLDVGGQHPINLSNTALLYQRGSRGISVRSDPRVMALFHQHRPEDVNLHLAVGVTRGLRELYLIDEGAGRTAFSRERVLAVAAANAQVAIQRAQPLEVVPLADIVAEHADGRFPDFLNLGLDGLDDDVLVATSFADNGPLVICVGLDKDRDPDALLRMVRLLRGQGYRLHMRTVASLILIQQDLLPALGLSEAPPI